MATSGVTSTISPLPGTVELGKIRLHSENGAPVADQKPDLISGSARPAGDPSAVEALEVLKRQVYERRGLGVDQGGTAVDHGGKEAGLKTGASSLGAGRPTGSGGSLRLPRNSGHGLCSLLRAGQG